ncbi:MAG TPA: hypothetical protein VN667_21560 [Burkholderiales bacterium]|nr:hypothetical protein [Burkholderiales bacterium]
MGGIREINRWREGDWGITPQNEVVIVERVAGHFLTVHYQDGFNQEPFQLHAGLVSKYVPGLIRPKPVVKGDAAEVAQRRATLKRTRW